MEAPFSAISFLMAWSGVAGELGPPLRPQSGASAETFFEVFLDVTGSAEELAFVD